MCVFFNDTATTEIYTLSLHDALPIWGPALGGGEELVAPGREGEHLAARLAGAPRVGVRRVARERRARERGRRERLRGEARDRKSTRLNSSHANISYAVFCLKKKKQAS